MAQAFESIDAMTFQWRFGVEEEYFLVDRTTGSACCSPDENFWHELKVSAPTASKELLQSQVEAKTPPCSSGAQCLTELQASRAAIDEVAQRNGMGLIASGTHPDFDWRQAKESSGQRYSKLVRDMRVLAFRNLFCGLHIHVEVPDGICRIELMNRCSPYLPLFLALSVSSPFWRGEWTGMHGYRLTGYDELPRTGLPPVFNSDSDYARYLDTLTRMQAIRDASFVWWAIRPSLAFPTLELRVCDSVTDVHTAVAIASLYRCLIFRLASDPHFGATPSPSLRAIAEENRWQVQCDGLGATIADVENLAPVTARDAIERFVHALAPEAKRFGCVEEFAKIGAILSEGTSAEHQIEVWNAARSPQEDLDAVKTWLLMATMA